MTRLLATLMLAAGLVVAAPGAAYADCDYGSDNGSGGTTVGGECGQQPEVPVGDPDNDDYSGWTPPTGPPPPVYEHYYTPACSVNGPPPGDPNALCQGAISICEARGGEGTAIYMRHYRREVPGGTWESMGSECRGPDDPVEEEPEATPEMVLDEAYAEAPRPTALVQPGTRSYVNIPNNYYADAPGETITVNVLGNPIEVTFTVNEISWEFGDGATATGEGVKDAAPGAAGAVEHAYVRQGDYTITANSTVGVQFTLPNGQSVNQSDAFQFGSEPVVLPVGEIQTRVDSTN